MFWADQKKSLAVTSTLTVSVDGPVKGLYGVTLLPSDSFSHLEREGLGANVWGICSFWAKRELDGVLHHSLKVWEVVFAQTTDAD